MARDSGRSRPPVDARQTYLNGEGGYADSDLVATTVTWLPWPSIRREHVIGLGGNVGDFWLDEPQLRRDDDGLFVTSTRYYPGVLPAGTTFRDHLWWERRRIDRGNVLDTRTVAASGLAVVLVPLRLARRRAPVIAAAEPRARDDRLVADLIFGADSNVGLRARRR